MNRLAVACLSLTVLSCASTPKKPGVEAPATAAPVSVPGLALRPADQVRAQLGLQVSAAAPEALAAALDQLAAKLQLPMQLGQLALDQLAQAPLAGLKLGREQLARLDGAQSIGVVSLPAGVCAALTFRDAALAQKTLEELGPEVQRAEGASVRKLASGIELWTGLSDRTLLVAPGHDALLAGGALAAETQRAPRDGLLALTIYPQNLAQAQGMPLSALVEMAAVGMAIELEQKSRAAAQAKKSARGKKAKTKEPELTPGMGKMLTALFRAVAQPIVEAQTVHLALKLNPSDGFLLRTEIVPLPGSPSAGRTQVTPYTLEPKIPVNDDRATVASFGGNGAAVASLLGALGSTGPKGQKIGAQLVTWVTQIVAGGTCVLPAKVPLTNLCAFQLRPGVTPQKAIDAYAAMMKNGQGWMDELLGPKRGQVKVKRSKDILEVEFVIPEEDPVKRAMEKAMWGGNGQRYAMAVRDGRLLTSQGAKPRDILARWGEPAKAGAAPLFASVAGRTSGAELLIYSDLLALVGVGIRASEEPSVKQVAAMMNALPGVAELKAPLVITAWGGKTTAVDLQLPFQTLANVAQVMRPFMGMMGGNAGPQPPPPAK